MDHETAEALVSDWARGRLDPARAREVEAHVRTCETCRAVAGVASRLESEQARLAIRSGAHPSPDRLASYVEAPDSEPIASLAEVGLHLRGCATCREDVTLMREAAAPGVWRVLLARFSPGFTPGRLLQPALAVALVLLVYPAWVGLVEYPRARRQAQQDVREAERRTRAEVESQQRLESAAPPRGGGMSALVLRGGTRGTEDRPAIRIREGQVLQPLLADVSPPAGTLHAALIREPDQAAWSAAGPREEFWDPANQLTGLLVPTAALTPGDYRLELSAAPGGPAFFTAGFRILASR